MQVTPVLGILHDMHARRAAADAGNTKAFANDPPPPDRVHLIFAASSHAELSLLDCSLIADARCAARLLAPCATCAGCWLVQTLVSRLRRAPCLLRPHARSGSQSSRECRERGWLDVRLHKTGRHAPPEPAKAAPELAPHDSASDLTLASRASKRPKAMVAPLGPKTPRRCGICPL